MHEEKGERNDHRNTKAAEEARIRTLIDNWANAMGAKDADGAMSQYAVDNVKFILAPPLQYTRDNPFGKKALEQWFSSFQGPIWLRNSRPEHHNERRRRLLPQPQPDESDDDRRSESRPVVRETLGFRKIDGKWTITHEHSSVPFYMDGSFKAAVDLNP